MNLGLAGRVAVVAAGSKGLGRAVAEELAAEGASVVICARGRAALDEACGVIAARGGRAHGVVADVSAAGEPARVVDEAARVFGPVDVLVTNSGGPRSGRFDVLSDEDWDAAPSRRCCRAPSRSRGPCCPACARGAGAASSTSRRLPPASRSKG